MNPEQNLRDTNVEGGNCSCKLFTIKTESPARQNIICLIACLSMFSHVFMK